MTRRDLHWMTETIAEVRDAGLQRTLIRFAIGLARRSNPRFDDAAFTATIEKKAMVYRLLPIDRPALEEEDEP